ncbi:MAG: CmpA/NrtA family ABC transporter substrate-binding protein [Pseudomonadota bacterium]
MSSQVLNCGYVPLVDSAPLILAAELGFAAQEGLSLNLLRQPSWAALRDLLALGHLDAAHMLSPLPVAMSLGLSGPKVSIVTPIVMSANGTVLGLSKSLANDLRQTGWQPDPERPLDLVAGLQALARPLRVGVPFPYSMHRLLFEYLIENAGPGLAERAQIVTMPPPLMAHAVLNGEIDLFFVGEPWGSVAVRNGAAELVLPGSGIWAHAPEKVLAMRADWAEGNALTAGALTRAIYRACSWLGQPANRSLAVEILARSEHLGLPHEAIDPALTGRISPRIDAPPWQISAFARFHGGATTFPWRSFGAWLGHQMSRLENLDRASTLKIATQCFRPDLYRAYLSTTSADMPGASAKMEGTMAHPTPVASMRGEMILGPDAFFDGKTFDFPEIF